MRTRLVAPVAPVAPSRTQLHLGIHGGFALIDVLVSCALLVTMLGITLPTWHVSRDRDAARMAARFLAQRLNMVRTEALRRNVMVAIRFDPDDLGRIGVYADGDGDGVLQRDIDQGSDPALTAEARLADYFAGVSFRIHSDVPSPDGEGVITADSDPIRIGSSNLLSFGPLGTSTSGTVYLAAGPATQVCVRILGTTGRVRVMWFDYASRSWRRG